MQGNVYEQITPVVMLSGFALFYIYNELDPRGQ